MSQHLISVNPRERLIDRELSWLAFNERVLELAEDQSNPLLERCRYLAIFSSNLDDFYMIRVATCKRKVESGVTKKNTAGYAPFELLAEISKKTQELISRQTKCFHEDLMPKLKQNGIEITDWEKPIYVKIGATRPYFDVALAVKAGADVIVLDGMQGGTAATQEVFIEHVGIPILAAIRPAVQALQDLGMHRKVQLIVSGGIRNGADVAKALALGADAVAIGTAALIALGDNDPELEAEYNKLGTTAGAYDDWHEGRDPAGITTQDPELMKRLDPVKAGHRLANYLTVMTMEAQVIARACGKSHLHNLEPEDLVALTIEASAMAKVPLAGTNWIPGESKF